VHRDFHSGNILNDYYAISITGLRLSKPINSQSETGQIFGVIPYVAPEVLAGKPYTPAADVYSFGIIAYDVLSELPPYCDRKYDISLSLDICKGLRPKFQIKIPQLLADLINRCWDADPQQRPSANELDKILDSWRKEISDKKDTEFYQHVKEAEAHNQTLPNEIRFPQYQLHEGVVFHSKLINTQQITQLLQQKVSEEYHTKALEELTLDNFNLEDIETEQIAQVEVSPKESD